jgi:hypothetical protein
MHDEVTGTFRAELAQRSAGEVLYDDYLVAQMRKGKPFKIALRKANAMFPAQALNPGPAEFTDAEAHYRFFLSMEKVDGYRRQYDEHQQQIAKVDGEIATLLESMTGDQGQRNPADSPQTGQPT